MARYYFDVRTNGGFYRDEVGDEFATFDEVREQAQMLLSDLVRDEPLGGETRTITCEVRDEMDLPVYRGRWVYEGTVF